MKKYITFVQRFGIDVEIKEVEVERETKSCVWVDGRKRSKASDYEQVHDTWERAHEHLLKVAEYRCTVCRLELNRANGVLGNVKGMKKPSDLTSVHGK